MIRWFARQSFVFRLVVIYLLLWVAMGYFFPPSMAYLRLPMTIGIAIVFGSGETRKKSEINSSTEPKQQLKPAYHLIV